MYVIKSYKIYNMSNAICYGRSFYENCNVRIEQAYKRSLEGKRIKTTKAVPVVDRNSERHSFTGRRRMMGSWDEVIKERFCLKKVS